MTEKSPPAMFAGVRPPSASTDQPKSSDSTKPADRVAATKTTSGGAPVGRFALGSSIPVLALIGIALGVTLGPVVALAVVGALVALTALGGLASRQAQRRVTTTTKVRPDGTVTTSTRPIDKRRRPPGKGPGKSPVGGNSSRRPFGGGRPAGAPGSSNRPAESPRGNPPGDSPKSRSWRDRLPGGGGRSNRNAAQSPPGSDKRGRSKQPMPGKQTSDGSPGGKSRQPGSSKWPFSRDRSKSPGDGPAGKKPGSMKRPGPGGSPPGLKPTKQSRWPWSRDKNQPDGKPAGGPSDSRSPKSKSPGGGGPKPHSPGGGSPGGSARPRGGPDRSTRPSKVPAWVKRAVIPAAPPPQREWTDGRASQLKDKARNQWRNAWADGDRKPARENQTRADRAPTVPAATAAPTADGTSERRKIPFRRKPASGSKKLATVQRGQNPTGAVAGLTAEADWMPVKQAPLAPKSAQRPTPASVAISDEAALMSGGAEPAPQEQSRPAPRPASKGGSSTVSDNGSSESQVSAGTTRAYDSAQRGARTGSALANNTANMLRADAERLPNTPRMAPHKAALGVQAGRWARVSAVYDAIASKLGQSAAKHQGGERLQ